MSKTVITGFQIQTSLSEDEWGPISDIVDAAYREHAELLAEEICDKLSQFPKDIQWHAFVMAAISILADGLALYALEAGVSPTVLRAAEILEQTIKVMLARTKDGSSKLLFDPPAGHA